MKILWLNAGLLLPLDKGGKLRTWHLMRHLAARHDITYLSFSDPSQRRRASRPGCAKSAAGSKRSRGPNPRKGTLRFYRGRRALHRRSDPVCGREIPVAGICGTRRANCSSAGAFDAVVCDFLPPVVNLPADAALSVDPLHAQRRSGDLAAARRERDESDLASSC